MAICLVWSLTAFSQDLSNFNWDEVAQQVKAQKENPSKLIMGLNRLAEEGESSLLMNYLITRGNQVKVMCAAKSGVDALKSDLEGMGATGTTVQQGMVSSWVPVDRLGELENMASLHCAMPEYKPSTNVGSVTSQGDQAMLTDLVKNNLDLNGEGITIGILSDAYNSLGGADAGVASGDLPGPGNPNGFLEPVEVLSEILGGPGIDEGRGMAELIHDVAPGATLKFYSAFNGYFDFADGIIALEEAGCDVIVDDIAYFVEPYFQDGTIAQAVTEVVNRGSAYFSSAGNGARESYEADFNPSGFIIPGIGEFHDFGGGDILQNVTFPPGAVFFPFLQWDDPSIFAAAPGQPYNGPLPGTDFDLLVFDLNTFQLIFSSADPNGVTGSPIEAIGLINPTEDSLTLGYAITLFSGPSDRRLKYIDRGDGLNPDEFDTRSGTSVGHSQAEGGFGIGASAYFNTPEFGDRPAIINGFSSAGGVPILLDPQGNRLAWPEIRQQPIVTGPDGANTSFFPTGGFDFEGDGFPNFFGTSASAPHVAALAALMLQATDKGLSPEEIGDILATTAEDMDDPATPGFDSGFDFGTGFGFVQGDLAVASVLDEPSAYRLQITNEQTGEVVTLRDGDVIDLADYPNNSFNLVALASAGTAQLDGVKLKLKGEEDADRTDKTAPFELFKANDDDKEDIEPGKYKFKATPFQRVKQNRKNDDDDDDDDDDDEEDDDDDDDKLRRKNGLSASVKFTIIDSRSSFADLDDDDDDDLKIDESFTVESFSAFPNPTSGSVTFNWVGFEDQEAELTIFNALGQAVMRMERDGSFREQVDLTSFGKGVFVARINANQQQFSQRIIVR